MATLTNSVGDTLDVYKDRGFTALATQEDGVGWIKGCENCPVLMVWIGHNLWLDPVFAGRPGLVSSLLSANPSNPRA